MSYDAPDYAIRREHCCPPTSAGATTEGSKFRHFQAIKLKKAHVTVITAGTSTAHGYDLYHGTTSVTTIALSTSAAGSVAHTALLNRDIGSLEQLSAKSLADTVGVAQVTYEFEVRPDAVES